MKRSNRVPFFVLVASLAALAAASPALLSAETGAQWSLQVNKVDTGDINLAPSFQIAIYENLLSELGKAGQFKQVLRYGDNNAGDAANLLVLKMTVQQYSAGSETRRAVTTVSGATKLTVRTQLATRDGKVILERSVNGNVRFFGSNLRATHNLAKNVAKAIKQSSLPEPSSTTSTAMNSESSADIVVVECR